jgi:hypothetical protein
LHTVAAELSRVFIVRRISYHAISCIIWG